MTDGSPQTQVGTIRIIGYRTAPDAPATGNPMLRLVGPILRHAELITNCADSTADFVAIQRVALPHDWAVIAAEVIAADPTIAAVVITGSDVPAGSDAFAEAGAGIVVARRAINEVGGLHVPGADPEGLGAEPDLQWRLAARGYRIVTLPLGPAGCYPRSIPLQTRLAVLMNNLEADTLGRCLPALVMASVTEPLRTGGADTVALDLQRSPGGDDVGTLSLAHAALRGIRAGVDLSDDLPDIAGTRVVSQATRRLTDRVMAPSIAPYLQATAVQAAVTAEIAHALPWQIDAGRRLHTLIISGHPPDSAGAARVAAIEAAARTTQEVLVASPADAVDQRWADAVVLEGVYARTVPWATSGHVPVLVDLTQWRFEDDLRSEHSGLERNAGRFGMSTDLLLETLTRADMIVVADDDQRDVALGLLAGCERLNDVVYDEDASLKSLVSILDPDGIAHWCIRPRRAIDLVLTLIKDSPAEEPGPMSTIRRLSRPLRRVMGGAR
jgi:hypothetical protein